MFLKTKGEFNCGSCKCISNVVISRGAYALASLVCIVALLIVVLYSIAGDHGSFLGLACVFAPFLIFYIMIPFFVKLAPCKDKSAVKRLLEKRGADVPVEAVYPDIPQTGSNPVQLDVDEDFSAKFMKVKSNAHRITEGADEEPSYGSESEVEDIQNTRIAFDLNEDIPEDNNGSETVSDADSDENIRIFKREENELSQTISEPVEDVPINEEKSDPEEQ